MAKDFSGIDFGISGDKLLKNIKGKDQTEKKQGRPPVDREKKKRVSMSLFPSDYEKIQQIAFVKRTSASDIFGDMMKKYIADNQDALKEFEKIEKE